MAEQEVQTKKGVKRSFVGIVTSDKMDKTVVVSIDTKRMKHTLVIQFASWNVAQSAKINVGVLLRLSKELNKVKELNYASDAI